MEFRTLQPSRLQHLVMISCGITGPSDLIIERGNVIGYKHFVGFGVRMFHAFDLVYL